jgi:hypothetical protein
MRLFSVSLLIIATSFTILSCGGSDKKVAEQKEEPAAPIKASKNSAALNQSFSKLLTSYFEVKDALVASDTAKANEAAATLVLNADSLLVNEIVDSSGVLKTTATNFAAAVSGSAKGLMGEKDLEAKRKEFQMISEAMYDLTRTIRYDQQKVYHQYCPMAFDNTGAYWLSKEEQIKNPYFGSKMLSCGETRDSLNF